jgi:RsiW-degrading membrane proteinase PrsW (M82 family)
VSGSAVWLLAVLAALVTGDRILLGTVVLLGSFVVPLTWVMRTVERDPPRHLSLPRVFHTFVYGGVAGLLVSAVLETWLLRSNGELTNVGVGLIEEAAKLAVLWWIGRRLSTHSMLEGLLLGAAVGFGFAAFESSGYALNALYGAGSVSLRALVNVQATRGLVAPVSHGLWTAITGAVLFRERRAGRFRLNRHVVGAYVFVSTLHAMWDLAPGLATALTLYVLGRGWHFHLLGAQSSGVALHAHVVLDWLIDDSILVVVAVLGLLALQSCRAAARAERTIRHITPLLPARQSSLMTANVS